MHVNQFLKSMKQDADTWPVMYVQAWYDLKNNAITIFADLLIWLFI